MYKFYLDGVELPVTPAAIKTKINGQNETVTLINEGEINILKSAGLTDYSFKCLLPRHYYPFVNKSAWTADTYLEHFEKLKTSEEPFRFVVMRISQGGKKYDETNKEVSLEDYDIEEDAKNGEDVEVSIKLKEYKHYGTQTVKIKELPTVGKPATVVKEEPQRAPSKNTKPYIGCNCIINGTVHRDSFGNGAGITLTNYKGKINIINNNPLPYHVTRPDGSWLGWVYASAVSNVT